MSAVPVREIVAAATTATPPPAPLPVTPAAPPPPPLPLEPPVSRAPPSVRARRAWLATRATMIPPSVAAGGDATPTVPGMAVELPPTPPADAAAALPLPPATLAFPPVPPVTAPDTVPVTPAKPPRPLWRPPRCPPRSTLRCCRLAPFTVSNREKLRTRWAQGAKKGRALRAALNEGRAACHAGSVWCSI
jgi:hypothetical protein